MSHINKLLSQHIEDVLNKTRSYLLNILIIKWLQHLRFDVAYTNVYALYISNHKTSIIKCITRKLEAPRLFSHLDQTEQLSKPYSLHISCSKHLVILYLTVKCICESRHIELGILRRAKCRLSNFLRNEIGLVTYHFQPWEENKSYIYWNINMKTKEDEHLNKTTRREF